VSVQPSDVFWNAPTITEPAGMNRKSNV